MCSIPHERKANAHTPGAHSIWDKYSPDFVSCIIGFSTPGSVAQAATHIPRPYEPKTHTGFAHAHAHVAPVEARRATH
jgi:hypothetical protein